MIYSLAKNLYAQVSSVNSFTAPSTEVRCVQANVFMV